MIPCPFRELHKDVRAQTTVTLFLFINYNNDDNFRLFELKFPDLFRFSLTTIILPGISRFLRPCSLTPLCQIERQ